MVKSGGQHLASKPQLVAVETCVFAGLAKQGEKGHDNLGGKQDQPEGHAYVSANRAPMLSY